METNRHGDKCERSRRQGYLISRRCVNFSSQRLGFGLGGKEVLRLVEAEAQDLPI